MVNYRKKSTFEQKNIFEATRVQLRGTFNARTTGTNDDNVLVDHAAITIHRFLMRSNAAVAALNSRVQILNIHDRLITVHFITDLVFSYLLFVLFSLPRIELLIENRIIKFLKSKISLLFIFAQQFFICFTHINTIK